MPNYYIRAGLDHPLRPLINVTYQLLEHITGLLKQFGQFSCEIQVSDLTNSYLVEKRSAAVHSIERTCSQRYGLVGRTDWHC